MEKITKQDLVEKIGQKTVKTTMPADQAAQVVKQFKNIWSGFSKMEKIMFLGALVSFIGFFLPWISVYDNSISGVQIGRDVGWVYIYPFLMLVSLALSYFTQGASNIVKILIIRWQIIIGTVFATLGVVGMIIFYRIIEFLQDLMGFHRGFGRLDDIEFSIEIGWWLLILGAFALLVGAFMEQERLVKK